MKKTGAFAAFLFVLLVLSLTGCDTFSGIIDIALPDYAAECPEIIEPLFIDFNVYRAYYNELTENEKTAYRHIYNNIFEYPSKIEIPRVTQEELRRIFEALKYDNPHVFFLGSECSASTSAGRCWFLPEYAEDSQTATSEMYAMLEQAREVLRYSDSHMGDYALELYIHDSLCAECTYDENAENVNNAYGALVEKKALCMGYSYAFKLMLDMAGLESAVVAGSAQNETGTSVRHMWNVVKIDGKWYNTDTTWDDPSGQNISANGELRHCYFNLSDAEILLDHTVETKPSYIVCESTEDGYYRREGLFCDNPDEAYELISRTVESVAVNGDIVAEIRFNSGEGLGEASAQLFEGGGMYEILRQAKDFGAVSLDAEYIKYAVVEKLSVLIVFLQYTE